MEECGGQDTELARAAFYQFTSRDEDTLMVPFYDMHNHSNDPKKLNTRSIKPRQSGKPFVLKSIRDIGPGEQVLISYNRCNSCWFDEEYEDCTSFSHYGTMHLFDIFGFVEDFPQSWHFRAKIEEGGRVVTDDLKFCLERSEEEDGDLLVKFGNNYSERPSEEQPVEGNIVWLGEQLVRLKGLEDAMKTDEKVMETVPGHEWYMVWRYHEALMTSISAAILASGFGGSLDEVGSEDTDGSEDAEGSGDADGSEDDSEDDSSDDDDEDEREPDESRESDDNNEDEGEPEKIEEVRDEL